MPEITKIIDTQTTQPVPEKTKREGYVIPFVKTEGIEPTGGNFALGDLLDDKDIQEGLNALSKRIDSNDVKITEINQKDASQDTEIGKKVDKDAQKIVDDRQDAGLERLEEDKADVITNFYRGQTPFVRTDTDEEPLLGMTIYGKTEQFSTEGNQLIDINSRESFTVRGVTYSFENGRVHAKGLCTETGNTSSFVINVPNFTAGETLYLSKSNGVKTGVTASVVSPSGAVYPSAPYLIKLKDDVTSITIYFKHDEGVTYDEWIDPMLNKGSSALPFEPYTGGKPSPSPDYPWDIKTAGASGSIVTRVQGKNLLDGSKSTFNSDRSIIYFYKDDGFDLKADTAYTFSAKRQMTFMYIIAMDGTVLQQNRLNSAVSYVPKKDVKVYLQAYMSEQPFPVVEDDFQLEIGSVATSYEPYKPVQTLTSATEGGLNGFNGVYDEVDYVTGKRIKRFGRWVFDGSADEPWSSYQEGYSITIPVKGTTYSSVKGNILCDSFIAVSNSDVWSGVDGIAINQDDNVITLHYSPIKNDISAFKIWLSQHPITVVAELFEPIVADISPEEMAQYHALHTYNPNTTISNDYGTEVYIKYRAETSRIVEQMAREIVRNEAIYEMGDNYIKYGNGVMECWGTTECNIEGVWGAWGSLYEKLIEVNMVFPLPFIKEPVVNIEVVGGVTAYKGQVVRDTLKISHVELARPVGTTGGTVKLDWHAIGKWK